MKQPISSIINKCCKKHSLHFSRSKLLGWLGSRVVSVLDSGAVGPGFKSQPSYDSRHLQADCEEPGSAPEPYAR